MQVEARQKVIADTRGAHGVRTPNPSSHLSEMFPGFEKIAPCGRILPSHIYSNHLHTFLELRIQRDMARQQFAGSRKEYRLSFAMQFCDAT